MILTPTLALTGQELVSQAERSESSNGLSHLGMRQEVISEFLNLPGLAGLVLTDQRSLPYVSGVYLKMTSQQRDLLTHGINQVLASIPTQFNVFEFQFHNYQVFIHRLSQGMMLLVIGYEQQLAQHYAPVVARLTAEIESTGDRAVAMMRLLAGDWSPLPAREPPPTSLTSLPEAPNLPEVSREEQLQSLAYDSALAKSVPTTKPVADTDPQDTQEPVAASPLPSTLRTSKPDRSPRSSQPLRPVTSPLPDRGLPDPVSTLPRPPVTTTSEPQETDTVGTAPSQVPVKPLKFEELFDNNGTTTLPSSSTTVARAVGQPTKSTGVQPSMPVQANATKSTPARAVTTTAKTLSTDTPTQSIPQRSPQASPASSLISSPVYSKNVLSALNKLSQYTTQYLGNSVVVNYWKSSRPKVEWLQGFTIERNAQLALPTDIAPTLTEQQHEWIRNWVQAFIKRCATVIRDFSNLVEQQALDETDKMLLL